MKMLTRTGLKVDYRREGKRGKNKFFQIRYNKSSFIRSAKVGIGCFRHPQDRQPEIDSGTRSHNGKKVQKMHCHPELSLSVLTS